MPSAGLREIEIMPPTGLIDNLLPDSANADAAPASAPSGAGAPQKTRWRYSSVFWRACYLAALLSPVVMFRREGVNSRPDHELRQGCNLLIGATGFPLRTTYHFRPVKNWMNGAPSLHPRQSLGTSSALQDVSLRDISQLTSPVPYLGVPFRPLNNFSQLTVISSRFQLSSI